MRLHRRFAVILGVTLFGAGCACDRGGPPAATQTEPADDKGAPKAPPPAPATEPATDNPAHAPATEVEIEYAEAGGLQYVERLAGDAKPDDVIPMIVAIHGLGDRPEDFARLLDAFPERARIIYPRGLDDFEGGFSWFPRRARDPDVEALAEGIDHAAAAIAKGIAALVESRPTRGKPIVTGFSQGGMLTFTLAVRHPEVVGYAVPVGGWLPPPLWPEAGPDKGTVVPPIVALHGTDDSAVLLPPTEEAVGKLAELGYDAKLERYEGVPHAIVPAVHRDLTDLLIDAVGKAARSKK